MNQRRGLGRGLGALIPSGPAVDEQRNKTAGSAAPSQDDEPSQQGSTWNGGSLERAVRPSRESALDPEGVQESNRDASTPGPTTPASRDTETAAGVDADRSQQSGESPAGAASEPFRDESAPETADGLREVTGARFADVPVARVSPNPRQPREVFDQDELNELAHSIEQIGLLQPIVVRPSGDGYELVMGERRWRAAQQASLEQIPAIVRETSDTDLLRDALLENLHRSELNPLEEAAAYQQLLEDFGCTHDELAERIGRSRPQISNTLRLLRLTPSVQRRVAAGILSAGHARALVGVEDGNDQERLAGRVVAEGLSVRALEELVSVGVPQETPATRHRANVRAPRLDDLAARLSERYDTRVKVDLGRSKGKITVQFASLEDLERIVDIMDPPTSPSPNLLTD